MRGGCHTGPGSGISADTRFVCRIERTGVKIVVPFTLSDGSLPKTERHMRLFHAHACASCRTLLRSTAPVARRMEEEGCPTPEQRMPCVV
ncbi:MAG: BT4734/BF3469 family protein [Parabacteroides merdae]